ncbi:hypothetical protein MTO96_000800 [Rhipicephalus appendiculatus]
MLRHVCSGLELRVLLVVHMFQIRRRNITAGTSAPAASPTPSESGQLRDTSTVAVPKSNRRKKRKSELSFSFGSTGSGFSSSPFNMQADLPELHAPVSLLALSRVLQKADLGERQFVVAEGAQQAAASRFHSKGEALQTPPKLLNHRLKPRLRSIENSSKRQGKASTSNLAESVTNRNRCFSPSQTR